MAHVRALIHRSLEGDVAPDERQRLEAHLRGCEECRRAELELRRNDLLLSRREPLLAVPLRRIRGSSRLGLVSPTIVAAAAIVVALIAGTQLAGWHAQSGVAATASPSASGGLSAAAAAGTVGICAGARQRVLGMTAVVQRADRIETKRMSMQDLVDGARWGTTASLPRDRMGSTFVCVVAISGQLHQQLGLLDVGTHQWGVFASIAGSDAPLGTQMGSGGPWPAYFDALPDRRGAPDPGTIVEIVGPQIVGVKLESPMMSAEFGNPALVRADAFTEISPAVPTLVATGVKVGDRVQVFFEREGRDPASGAYPLSIFSVVPEAARPAQSPVGGSMPCPAGQIPILHIADPPPPGDSPGAGSASAEAAFRKRYPAVTKLTMYAFGSDRPATGPADLGRGPVWIVAGNDTYIAQAPGAGGANDWYAYPAKFVGCRAPSPTALRTWLAQSSLYVDGYQFTVRVVSDPSYGPQPSAAWAVSAVSGIGLSCEWLRTGPDVGTVDGLWGTPGSVVSIAGYDNVRPGTAGNGLHGIPLAAITGSTATTVCGVRDAAGQHGVVTALLIPQADRYTDASVRLLPWTPPSLPTPPPPGPELRSRVNYPR